MRPSGAETIRVRPEYEGVATFHLTLDALALATARFLLSCPNAELQKPATTKIAHTMVNLDLNLVTGILL
jgi:hypothetical protein